MYLCKICNKKFKQIGRHAKNTHHMDSKTYFDLYLKTDNDGLCLTCRKPTKWNRNLFKYNDYCCQKCQANSTIVRNKAKQTCLNNHGVEYGTQTINNKIAAHSKTATQKQTIKRQQTMLANYNYKTNLERPVVLDKIHTVEAEQKRKQTKLDKYGTTYPNHSSDAQHKAYETKKRNGHQSKLEYYFEQQCKQLNINYKSQYDKDFRYPYMCDFYLDAYDLFVEINGFWMHNKHLFDYNSKQDLYCLEQWKQKSITSQAYKRAIDIWTKEDLIKYNTAKNNNLNYIILWSINDINNFFKNLVKGEIIYE